MAPRSDYRYVIAVAPKMNKKTGEPMVGYSSVYVGYVNVLKAQNLAPWASVAGYIYTGEKAGGQLFLSPVQPRGCKKTSWPRKHYIVKNEDIINFISSTEGIEDITHRIKELANANDFKDYIIVSYTVDGKHSVAKLPNDARAKLMMHFIAKGTGSVVKYRPVVVKEEKKFMVDFCIDMKNSYLLHHDFADNYFLKGDNIWLTYIEENEKSSELSNENV